MRILFFTRETHPSSRADISVLFGKYLPRHGVDSDLVAQQSAPGAAAPWPAGRALVCRRASSRARNAILPFLHALQVLMRVQRGQYDAIQVRDNPVLALFGLIAARRLEVPFYYWMSFPIVEGHFVLASEGPRLLGWPRYLFALVKGYVGRWLYYCIVAPRCDRLFVQSDRMKVEMMAKGIPADRLIPVPMGVDTELADSKAILPATDPRLAGRRVAIYLGSLDRSRRIDMLLDMLALTLPHVPDLVLVLVGEAPEPAERARLMRHAEALGVSEQVIWTGWLPMHEAWRYVRAAQVGLSPIPRGPLYDVASPTKAAEYLALGVPVLGSDLPDQAWLIRASTGGLCVMHETHAFADALIAMLDDPQVWRERAEKGREFVLRQRSYEVLSQALAAAYRTGRAQLSPWIAPIDADQASEKK